MEGTSPVINKSQNPRIAWAPGRLFRDHLTHQFSNWVPYSRRVHYTQRGCRWDQNNSAFSCFMNWVSQKGYIPNQRVIPSLKATDNPTPFLMSLKPTELCTPFFVTPRSCNYSHNIYISWTASQAWGPAVPIHCWTPSSWHKTYHEVGTSQASSKQSYDSKKMEVAFRVTVAELW